MSNVMKDAFSELEGIWSRCIANDRKYMFEEILDLLKQQGPRGIRIRPVDGGELRQITLSKPTVLIEVSLSAFVTSRKVEGKLRTILLRNLGARLSATTRALLNKNGPSTEERTAERSSLQKLLTNHHPQRQK